MKLRIGLGVGIVLVLAAGCAHPRGAAGEREAGLSPPASAISLADAIRLARARFEKAIVVQAGRNGEEPGEFFVVLHSQGRMRGVGVDAVSGETVERVELAADTEFFEEAEAHLPAAKIDLDRAMEIALAPVPGGTVREIGLGLAGDGPETRVTYRVTVESASGTSVKRIDLSTGEVIEREKADLEIEIPRHSVAELETVERNFDDEKPGELPENWILQATGPQGSLATWEVVAEGSNASPKRALALTSTNHDSSSTFNLCWTDDIPFENGTIELSMKPVSGDEDQGGGPIWRAEDKDNYYVCRANPLEDNFRLYVVKGGERKQLASAAAEIAAGEWHAIRVEHVGDRIACWLDEKKLLEAVDATFPGAGGVGFWTKADAVTSFDDLRISSRIEPKDDRGR